MDNDRNIELFLQQKDTLDKFLSRGAISQAQYDKSYGDLVNKMGMEEVAKEIAEKTGTGISLTDAVKIATALNDKYDSVQEYSGGYHFFVDDGVERAGGADCGIVVSKIDGRKISISEYFLTGKSDCIEIGGVIKLSYFCNNGKEE